MLQKSYKTFGLILTLPFLFASSETANLSDMKVEKRSVPALEIQPLVETSSEPALTQEEYQLTQPQLQNRREGREYCQGIGVC